MSNPKVATLYALPKIHKNPISMRPICSNVNVPNEHLAKYLVETLKNYPIDFGYNVKNTFELVDKIKEIKLKRGEILGSFDIVNMYPNIPADEAITIMEKHLIQKNAPNHIVKTCVAIAKLCMEQNFFQFRGKYYKQTFGLSMGSKISPFLANIYISNMEEQIKNNNKNNLFPRIWARYVDDIFVVIKERYVDQLTNLLNNYHPKIKFTFEKESNNSLPFLDVLISKTNDDGISFSIFRKPTSTERFITSDSHHSGSNQKAAFHSMIHRLLNIPMNEANFNNELMHIKNIAQKNGYNHHFVEKILQQHKQKINQRNITALIPIEEEKILKRISVPFYPKITNPLSQTLQKHEIQLVQSSSLTLKNILCNYKDKIPEFEKAGIYEEACQNCDTIYIGQTKRKLIDRHKEHKRHTLNKQINSSAVAQHMIENNHKIDDNKFNKIRTINKNYLLDSYESFYITTSDKKLMNREEPPIQSHLYQLAQNYFK